LADAMGRDRPHFGLFDEDRLRVLLKESDSAGRFEFDNQGRVRKVHREGRRHHTHKPGTPQEGQAASVDQPAPQQQNAPPPPWRNPFLPPPPPAPAQAAGTTVTSDIHTRPCVPGVWNSCNRSDFLEGRNWEEREKRKGLGRGGGRWW